MAVKVSYVQTLRASAAQDRELLKSVFPQAGIVSGLVASLGGGMVVTIGTGKIIVPAATSGNLSGAFSGYYHFLNDAAVNLTIGAASASPRVDTIVARIRDSAEMGTDPTLDGGDFIVLAGTPTAGANSGNLNGVATVPANQQAVAYVEVPVGAVSITTLSQLFVPRAWGGPPARQQVGVAIPWFSGNWSGVAYFRKDRDGYVHLEGAPLWGQGVTPTGIGNSMFQLPVGYRPFNGGNASFIMPAFFGYWERYVLTVFSDGRTYSAFDWGPGGSAYGVTNWVIEGASFYAGF